MANLSVETTYVAITGARDLPVLITAESHTIDANGIIELAERPDETQDVLIPGYVVTDYAPINDATCQLLSRTGRVQFIPDLVGTVVEVTYYGVGTIIRDDHFNDMHTDINRLERRNASVMNAVITAAGDITYTTGTVTFPATLTLYLPNNFDDQTISSYTITGGATAIAEGAVLYVTLTDTPGTALTISSSASLATYAALSAATKMLAYRPTGTSIVLWNGYVLANGETYDRPATESYVDYKISNISHPDHNDLSGLNEGDYLHLTAAEKAYASSAISAMHTQGTDTTMGNWTTDINANSHKLTGLAAPVSANDAARKAYVDSVISSASAYCAYYPNVNAADDDAFLTNPGGIDNGTATPLAQPDVPRQVRIYVDVTGGGGSGKTATFVLTGTSANGTALSQTWSNQDLGTVLTLLSNNAYATCTSVVISGVSSVSTGTFVIGYTDILGLPNYPFGATGVFKVEKNNANITPGSKSNTYGTVDCAVITTGDNLTFWYKP